MTPAILNSLLSSGQYVRTAVAELNDGDVDVDGRTMARVDQFADGRVRVLFSNGDRLTYLNERSTILIENDAMRCEVCCTSADVWVMGDPNIAAWLHCGACDWQSDPS